MRCSAQCSAVVEAEEGRELIIEQLRISVRVRVRVRVRVKIRVRVRYVRF